MNNRTQGFVRSGITALGLGFAFAPCATLAETPLRYDQAIFALEHALIGVGYELEPVDGLMDPTTHRALMDYQKQHNLAETNGSITDETLSALGIQPVNQVATESTTSNSADVLLGSSRPNETIRIKPIETEVQTAEKQKSEESSWLFF